MKKKISLFSIAILLFVIFMISALFFDFNKKDKGDKVKKSYVVVERLSFLSSKTKEIKDSEPEME